MNRRTVFLAVAGLFAALLVATPSAPADAEVAPLPDPKVHPVQVTGPAAERLNLVILGDGYQADQQSLFHADVDRNLAVMWATEPFRSYRNYINVYAVEIASIDYGARCDPDGRVRDAIVVPSGGHTYALMVEEVEDVILAAAPAVPSRAPLGQGWDRVALGMVEADGELFLLVDPHQLIAGPAARAA